MQKFLMPLLTSIYSATFYKANFMTTNNIKTTYLLKENSKEHKNFKLAFNMVGISSIFDFSYTKEETALLDKLKIDHSKICDILERNKLQKTELILLKANGNQDGHAIKLNNKIVTFLDFKAYLYFTKQKKWDEYSHLLHEMIHGSHYSVNPDLEPTTLKYKDKFLAKSLVEGACVYISSKLNPSGDNYWFNFLNKADIREWIHNCKKLYHQDLLSLSHSNYTSEQKTNLLGLNSSSKKNLLYARRAYYSVSTFFNTLSLNIKDILSLTPESFKKLLKNNL